MVVGFRIDPFKQFINTVCKLIVHSCWTEFNSKAHFHGKYLAGGPMLMPFEFECHLIEIEIRSRGKNETCLEGVTNVSFFHVILRQVRFY